jgi:spiro-SPASM protein
MNYIAFYADNSPYLFERCFDGKNAFERAVLWAQKIPECAGTVFFVWESARRLVEEELSRLHSAAGVVAREEWNAKRFVAELAEWAQDKGDASLIFALTSSPFYDAALTRELISQHKKYASEYTFAEGYAEGLVPAVIDSGALKSLAELSKTIPDNPPLNSRALFEVMKSRVNSFEVETLTAPRDVRFYRFDFSCVTKRALLACQNLYHAANERGIFEKSGDETFADDLGALAAETPRVQRVIPSFYDLQISAFTEDTPIYSPYAAAYAKKFSHAPRFAREKNPRCFMPLDQLKKIADEAAEFSGEAVVSLSAWGEALAHPDICAIIEAVLAHSGLSLMIETDGSLVTRNFAERAASIAHNAPPRINGHKKIYWIVKIDAVDQEMYGKMRATDEKGGGDAAPVDDAPDFEKADAAYKILSEFFGEAAYAQFTRTTVNEAQLEAFYRGFKERGSLIIQKYDSFCGRLPNLRPADLSPLERGPCWHFVRDLVILADGSVPLCKEQALDALPGVNVFETGLEAAWKKIGEVALNGKADVQKLIMPCEICKDCDEYYTFNF